MIGNYTWGIDIVFSNFFLENTAPFSLVSTVTLGAPIPTLPLPSTSSVVMDSNTAFQVVYQADPPLPAGTSFQSISIVGTPTLAQTTSHNISVVDSFSGQSLLLGVVHITVEAPPVSSPISSGSLMAIIIGSILGFFILILVLVVIAQRRARLHQKPFNFDSIVAADALSCLLASEKSPVR